MHIKLIARRIALIIQNFQHHSAHDSLFRKRVLCLNWLESYHISFLVYYNNTFKWVRQYCQLSHFKYYCSQPRNKKFPDKGTEKYSPRNQIVSIAISAILGYSKKIFFTLTQENLDTSYSCWYFDRSLIHLDYYNVMEWRILFLYVNVNALKYHNP